jgi:pimeloyl-ACP methyl ester carboxylesterase/ribosomal protein S18 acetylase RimI-like enzyme
LKQIGVLGFFSLMLETITFSVANTKLLGTFWRAETSGGQKCPTVLLLHGIPGTEKNTDLAYALCAAGWNCLTFHYRGCWGSDGNYSLAGNLEDVTAAIDYLANDPSVDMERFVLAGLSLGGYNTIAIAARDPRVKAAIPMSPLVTPQDRSLDDAAFTECATILHGVTAAELRDQWFGLTPASTLAPALAGRPVLLLTGDVDDLFPPHHIQPLADAMPFATWQRLPLADHAFSNHRPDVIRIVLDWLTETFTLVPPLPAGFTLRKPVEADHARVVAVLNDWWGGRDLSHLLPRLYFHHFNHSSFIIEKDGQLAAFLTGFISQAEPGVAYIHFVGVHPQYRKDGLARAMYERFFGLARARGAREVHCITGTVNATSIAFHQRMGFHISEPIPHYDGPDGDRVSMVRRI